MSVSKRKEQPSDGLVGMWLHTFHTDGTLEFQGRIADLDGDRVLVQFFSWMTGAPTNVEPIWKSKLYSPAVILYASDEDMKAGYERYARAKGEWFAE